MIYTHGSSRVITFADEGARQRYVRVLGGTGAGARGGAVLWRNTFE